jgi:hypothetical protein
MGSRLVSEAVILRISLIPHPLRFRAVTVLRFLKEVTMQHVEIASWILIASTSLSLVYELYRVTAKAGISKLDSPRVMVQALPLNVVFLAVAILLRQDWTWIVWVALGLSLFTIVGIMVWYLPKMLPQREPKTLDYAQIASKTGLEFIAVAFLISRLADVTLAP